MEVIKYSLKDRIATIQINRSEKRNALNDQVVTELKKAFQIAEAEEQVKVIVLTGSGTIFSAGADLKYLLALQKYSKEENLKDSENLMSLFKQIYTTKKIVIAKVNGAALAGGCGLVSVCDFAFSTTEAKFGYTEVRLGFVPAIVMSFLIRKVGESKARELLLSGEIIDSDKAERIGLINGSYEEKDFDNAVAEFAQNLCKQNSSSAMLMTKEMIAAVQDLSLDNALNYAVEMNVKARATSDFKEGISAFVGKIKKIW